MEAPYQETHEDLMDTPYSKDSRSFPFHEDYLKYCEANKDEVIKVWQEENEPVVWKYNLVPLFDFIQLFEMLDRHKLIHIDFTRIDKWCLDVSDDSGDIKSAEATNKEECILRMLLEIRRENA